MCKTLFLLIGKCCRSQNEFCPLTNLSPIPVLSPFFLPHKPQRNVKCCILKGEEKVRLWRVWRNLWEEIRGRGRVGGVGAFWPPLRLSRSFKCSVCWFVEKPSKDMILYFFRVCHTTLGILMVIDADRYFYFIESQHRRVIGFSLQMLKPQVDTPHTAPDPTITKNRYLSPPNHPVITTNSPTHCPDPTTT